MLQLIFRTRHRDDVRRYRHHLKGNALLRSIHSVDADDIEFICRELDLVHVVDPFVSPQTYGDIGYYRLHGRNGYRYKYTADDLALLKDRAREKKDCYVLFNNVHMYEDAAAFNELVRV